MNTNDINQCGQQDQQAKVAEVSGLLRAATPRDDGPEFPNYPVGESGNGQNRLINLAMQELDQARRERNMAIMERHTANSQNQLLSKEISRAWANVKMMQEELGEQSQVLNQRAEEIAALRDTVTAKQQQIDAIDLDPTKRRIRQLLKRIREMAPQTQFEVRKKSGRKFGILGAMSSNGVTVITVTNQPVSR